jgi:16S rRNA (guanine1207-N2)-methyltransferase
MAGLVEAPPAGARALFLGARPGLRTPDGFNASLSLVQGFRPDYLALQREGHAVSPVCEGDGYDAVLVLAGRHRGENELRIAAALDRAREGVLILVAGGNDDGIASLAKRIGKLAAIEGRSPKHHGLAFWLRASRDRQAIAAALKRANAHSPVDGRFATAPGMFSHDRIDPGSKLLAGALPADLSGRIADFCAGWGYLSAEIAARFTAATALDLYEADFASIEAAKANLANVPSPPLQYFWHDLVSEPVEARYGAIVMNPPFHRGRAAEPEIGTRLIAVAAKSLTSRGKLFLVANKGLPYEKALAPSFANWNQIASDNAFKVFAAIR